MCPNAHCHVTLAVVLVKMIRLRKEDYGGVLIDKEQISFIEILTKHITNININLNTGTLAHWHSMVTSYRILQMTIYMT